MEKQYAQALERLIKSGVDEKSVVDKLVAHVRATGRMKLLPLLLRELRVIEARKRNDAPLLEVASKDEQVPGVATAPVVNPSLISGWRLKEGGTLTDRSGKRALVDIYRRITG